MLYIYLSNIFHVTGTKITACRPLCQEPSSRGCNAELWFSSKAVLLVVCSVKNCLPQVVKDRCPLLKVIPNKSKAAFVFNSAKDFFSSCDVAAERTLLCVCETTMTKILASCQGFSFFYFCQSPFCGEISVSVCLGA